MNKLLVVIFDNEAAADAGRTALRALHAAGDITLYASGVLTKDATGVVSVRKSMESGPVGTAIGLAIGSLIGLLGGPIGAGIGAVKGTVVGAVRDFWVAGVGLDFIEGVTEQLLPGKAALVAEVEEEWVTPVDSALSADGGHVFRRTRTEVAEAQFDHDVVALKSEIKGLESEMSHAGGPAKTTLQAKLVAARSALNVAGHRAQRRVDTLTQEADAKAALLTLQLSQVKGDVKAKIEERMSRVRVAYHARGAKLSQAWNLVKDALSA